MPEKTDIEAIAARSGGGNSRLWPWAVAAIVVAGGAWYWFAQGGETRAVRYTTQPATVTDIVVTVTATGTIEPVNTVEISSELSGTVRAVNADYNSLIKKGDILAELDTDKLEANVAYARATLTARQASLVEAEVTLAEKKDAYDRAQQLSERGISTQETLLATKAAYERAMAALDTAKANVEIAEASLTLAETDLDKACICSPVDGIVLDRAVEVGQIVAASLSAPTLFTLAEDLKHMNLTVDIDEADIGQVAVGNTATFTVEAYQGEAFSAEITQLRYAPEEVDGVVTYKAILGVDNSELLLRPGMTATADIIVAKLEDTLAVPNAALRFAPPAEAESSSGGGSGLLGMLMPRRPGSNGNAAGVPDAQGMRSIWVLENNEPAERKVRTGRSDGSFTAILEGELAEGERLITDMDSGQ